MYRQLNIRKQDLNALRVRSLIMEAITHQTTWTNRDAMMYTLFN